MPEPVIAAAAENGKKRGWLTFDWLADVPKLTLRTVKKRPAQIRLAGGRAEAHAENGKKN